MKNIIRNKKLSQIGLLLVGILASSLSMGKESEGVSMDTKSNHPLKVNQVQAYGLNGLSALTFPMNFACVHEASSDLNFNGKIAAIDPLEFAMPICSLGTEPKISITGKPIDIADDDSLYLLGPWFDADNDNESALSINPELAASMKKLFNGVPDAFDPTPGIAVHCPEPGLPRTERKGEFGTCTMQPISVDLGPAMVVLGLIPPNSRFVTPLPNHSMIINGDNLTPKWRQIKVVMVNDANEWPDADGTKGVTSLQGIRDCQANKKCAPTFSTNLFMYFSAKSLQH